MKFLSNVIAQGSGKMGNMVAARNRSGNYLRERVVPVNPSTARQQVTRNAVKTLAAQWVSTLTTDQRQAWEQYAVAVPLAGKLGSMNTLTGLNMFVRSNAPRLQAGLAIVTAAPTTHSLGDLTPGTLTLAASSASATLGLSTAQSWTSSGDALLVYASSPQNASVNFFKGPYRYAGKITPTGGTLTASNPITLPFAAGPAGSKVFTRQEVSRADGRLTSSFPGSVLV